MLSRHAHTRAPTPCACLLLQDKVTVPDRDYSTQRVILGTHTSENEQNHLIIAGATCGGRQYAGGGDGARQHLPPSWGLVGVILAACP